MAFQEFTPLEYLKIDIASNYGLEKESWDIRLDWFNAYQELIDEINELCDTAPKKVAAHPLMKQADAPALFFAGVRAYAQAVRGEAFHYPISLDATASGAQLLAVLIGCEKSARLCNVIDTGNREDLYTNIRDFMDDYLSRVANHIAAQTNVDRDDAKKAVMTSLYGSKAMPRRVFGEDTPELQTFYEVMENEAPGIWALNEALLGLWQPNALSHDWVLPDNFHVKTKVMAEKFETFDFAGSKHEAHWYENRPTAEGLSIGANIIHSLDGMVVREMSRRCSYDPEKLETLIRLLQRPVVTQVLGVRSPNHDLVETLWDLFLESGFLSARILEVLDEETLYLVDPETIRELIATLPDTPFEVLSVHDCFRVHPNYGNDLRRQYNQILHELARSKVLQSIASQIEGHKVIVNKYDDIAAMVLDANYALS